SRAPVTARARRDGPRVPERAPRQAREAPHAQRDERSEKEHGGFRSASRRPRETRGEADRDSRAPVTARARRDGPRVPERAPCQAREAPHEQRDERSEKEHGGLRSTSRRQRARREGKQIETRGRLSRRAHAGTAPGSRSARRARLAWPHGRNATSATWQARENPETVSENTPSPSSLAPALALAARARARAHPSIFATFNTPRST
ncbi:MAG: hypothetical protein JWO86_549, partial [Myxococcaceae bacterium]|nr:hypothetical protein [Myxococcaceae bacterium]